jgi:hypothetical protein
MEIEIFKAALLVDMACLIALAVILYLGFRK